MGGAVGDDIDDITAFQFVIQWHQAGHEALAIATAAFGGDTRTRALIPDLGMYAVGKIERGRADRQIFDFSFGGKDKNLFVENFVAHRLYELAIIGGAQVTLPISELAQP